MNQVLSENQIRKLMEDPKQDSFKPRWPSSEDKRLILTALKNKQKKVELSGGMFEIRYSDGIPYKASSNGNHSTAFVCPTGKDGGFVPCGWFDPKTLEKELEGVL